MLDSIAFHQLNPDSTLLKPRTRKSVDVTGPKDDEIICCSINIFGFSYFT